MLLARECFCAVRNTPLFLNVNKCGRSKCVPFRHFLKGVFPKSKDLPSSNNSEEPEKKRLYGYDDENFSELLKSRFWDVKIQKEGFRKLRAECKRFYDEEINGKFKWSNVANFEIEDERTKVKMLYKFEKEEDLNDFNVLTDSTFLKGYSSASFRLTENETAVFSGNICKDIPKTGDVSFAGYANLQCAKQRRAFFRIECYDFMDYTHLVFKIRGDGRTYSVIMHLPGDYEQTKHYQYAQPLYTRGGPYWQIVKLPFSHFYFVNKGKIQDRQDGPIPLQKIVNISITAGGYGGPFKLEIDYIGLEHQEHHKSICPYEEYRV